MTRYRFDMVCPRCDKTSETVSINRTPMPRVHCGDCLMNDVEIATMIAVRVTALPDNDNAG